MHEQRARRGYGQYCAVASALDVVGERWTLLVIRDLLMGPKRYTDLREGLPGIATDLLTARLRTLEAAGLVQRRTLPRPAPATVYELTERGRLLGPVVGALARVGFAFVGEPAAGGDVPAERLVLALRASFDAGAVPGLEEAYQLELGGEPFVVRVRAGEVEAEHGTAPDAGVEIHTDPITLVRLLRNEVQPDEAIASEAVRLDGPRDALERFVTAFAWTDVSPAA